MPCTGQKVLCSPGKIKEAEINERLERLENLNRHTGIPCSQAVLKSIAEADEFSLDYSIVEAAIAHVIQEEARGGESALLQNWEGLDAVDLSRVGKLDGPGAILVFLPGSIEISKLQKQLKASARLKTALNGDEAQILPLHGSLAPAQQQAVFRRFGRNCRKIVLSTNIAETCASAPTASSECALSHSTPAGPLPSVQAIHLVTHPKRHSHKLHHTLTRAHAGLSQLRM